MKYRSNIISRSATLRDALKRINELSGKEMTLFVVDNEKCMHMLGTLTNGDIRRGILAGKSMEDSVETVMFPGFKRILDSEKDKVDAIRTIRKLGITLIPVVDKCGCLVDVVDLNRVDTILPLQAVLMAGGKGERLRPMTLDTPKPLLKVDGKAIIDYNIESLVKVGITDISVATRYLADKIAGHFSSPIEGVQVKCVREEAPLGTIGAVSLIDFAAGGNTLVMNSDLLTTISFEEMYLKHRDTEAYATVGVIPYQISVPYAILSTEGDIVSGIEEKPSYSYYANAGIYIFRNEVLKSVAKDTPTDAPDLIRNVIAGGHKVTYHVINGTWIDIGSPTDFRQAQELMRHHRNLGIRY